MAVLGSAPLALLASVSRAASLVALPSIDTIQVEQLGLARARLLRLGLLCLITDNNNYLIQHMRWAGGKRITS